MNVKCRSDFVTVFPPGRGHYQRTIEEVTLGNVYEVIEIVRSDYYEILPDKGTRTMELPSYMFIPTDEEVTPNPDREIQAKTEQEKNQQFIDDHKEQKRAQGIKDSMDRYYDPRGFQKRQCHRKIISRALSEHLVGGLPFD